MDNRTFNLRNFVGGVLGGTLGILLFAWAGMFVGLLACTAGFLLGYYHKPIWELAVSSAKTAWACSSKRASAARTTLWNGRIWLYLFVGVTALVPPIVGHGWEPLLAEGGGTLSGALLAALCPAAFTMVLIIVAQGIAVSAFKDRLRDQGVSDLIFKWFTDVVLIAFFLFVFVLPGGIVNMFKRFGRWCSAKAENFRTSPELRLTYAHAIARVTFSLVWTSLLIEVIWTTLPTRDAGVGLIFFLCWAAIIMAGNMISDGQELSEAEREAVRVDKVPLTVIQEAHNQACLARRLDKLEELGFARYTIGFCTRMFTLIFAGSLMMVWTFCVLIPIIVFWALGIGMPVMFAFLFVKNLPRVSDGTHWAGMLTTLAVTGTTALLLEPHLAGMMLLGIAFANGLACGVLSIGVCKLAGRSHKLIPGFAWLSAYFETGTKAFEFAVDPAASRFERAMFAGPLGYPMRRLRREDNYGL